MMHVDKVSLHNAHTGQTPHYITDILTPTATMANRSRLRSAAGTNYELPLYITKAVTVPSHMPDQDHGTVFPTNSDLSQISSPTIFDSV